MILVHNILLISLPISCCNLLIMLSNTYKVQLSNQQIKVLFVKSSIQISATHGIEQHYFLVVFNKLKATIEFQNLTICCSMSYTFFSYRFCLKINDFESERDK